MHYRRGGGLRSLLFILLLVFVGWKVVYPAYFAGNVSLPVLPSSSQTATKTEYIYITVPASTQTPLPTYTPYPTLTPQPTPQPQTVYTSDADAAYRTWSPRILLFVMIGFVFWLVWHYYKLKQYEIDRNFELEMTHIKAQESVMQSMNPNSNVKSRPLVYNVHRGNGDEQYLVTAFDKKIPHSKVKEFVENVSEIGLSINQWRTEMKWPQQDIESMLDHLESIQLLHPREQGKAAEWRRNVQKENLARMLGVELVPDTQ